MAKVATADGATTVEQHSTRATATTGNGGKKTQRRATAATAAAPPKPTRRVSDRQALPAKSIEKAARAFKNFSLSRFGEGARPRNFVHPEQAKSPQATQAVQRKVLSDQIIHINVALDPNLGTTLGLTPAAVQSLLPTYDEKSGTIPMADVLAVLRQKMTGTEFYSRGVPPVVQSAQQSQIQAQVQAIIQSITQGPAK